MNKKLNNKGFTLVELLAALAILIAIMAIAIPSISSSLERTKAKQNASREKVILSAAELYVADHKNVIYKNLENKGTDSCYILISDINYLTDEELEDADGNPINGYVFFKKPNSYTLEENNTGLSECYDGTINNNSDNDTDVSDENSTGYTVLENQTIQFIPPIPYYQSGGDYYFSKSYTTDKENKKFIFNEGDYVNAELIKDDYNNFFSTYKYVCYNEGRVPYSENECNQMMEITEYDNTKGVDGMWYIGKLYSWD